MIPNKKACCVKYCLFFNTPGLTYFTLPEDIERRKQWLNLIGRQDLVNKKLEPSKYVICSAHFDQNQIGVIKETPEEAIPTKHVPTKRKGVYIISTTTATQTDFSSSSDDDDDDYDDSDIEFFDASMSESKIEYSTLIRKTKLVTNGKVTIYKNLKPNRKVYDCCDLDDNNLEPHSEVVSLEPTHSLKPSENKPNDSVDLGNRKLFVFEEGENTIKRHKFNDDENIDIIVTNSLEQNASLPKVAIIKSGVPNRPVPLYSVNAVPVSRMPIPVPVTGVPLPKALADSTVPNDCGRQIMEVTNPIQSTSYTTDQNNTGGIQIASSGAVAENNIVISNVVTLHKTVDNRTFNEFFEWNDRTTGRRRGPKYDKDFNLFALNLHTINSRAYRLLMESWQLPTEEQLKGIQLNIGLGFEDGIMRLLTQKFKSLSKEAKYCTLGVYAMALKPQFYYDPASDEVIGIRNVNGIKSRVAAKYALIAMVRGLNVPWQQPVAFALFSSMTDMDYIDVYLCDVINKMKNAGLKILGLVMSDDEFFWKYCKTKNLSVALNYLTIDKSKVYAVFDIPHVLNTFKDDFMENDLEFENKTISWDYIQQVYDIDKQREKRLLPKLTDEHFAKSKQKGLKHPCQVFSRAVSAAMHFYIDHGLMEKDAIPTAEFIKKFNDIFDVLNSKSKNTEPYSKTPAVANLKALDSAHLLFKRLKIDNGDSNDKSEDIESLKTLTYFLVSVKSLVAISHALSNMTNSGIAQSRLTYLEPLQEFVKSIQNETKTNRPTPIHFVKAFSKLILKHLVELTPPPNSIGNMDTFLKMADSVKDSYEVYEGKRIYLKKDTDYRFELPEVYAIIYVSSYLIYKCLAMHKCVKLEKSVAQLLDLNKTKTYVHFEKFNKDALFYDKLKLPAMSFVSYVERLDICFVEMFNEVYHTTPAESIYGVLKKVPSWEFPCPCFPQDYLFKLFVRTRIYQTISQNTKCLKTSSSHSLVAKKL